MGKNFAFLFILISFSSLLNAQDLFDEYKIDYDQFRKYQKHDSALVVAKQMNSWALKYETDTSLRYAVSLRYVGNCYHKLEILDSALIYYEKCLKTLVNQNRSFSIEAAECFSPS